MSIKLMTMAFNAYVFNPVRKLILIKLCDNANDDGVCWPSYAKIADQCEVSRRCVMEHIKWLSDNGFLVIESRFKDGNQSSNCYTISTQKLMESSASYGENCSPPSDPGSPPLVNVVHPPSDPGSPRTIIEPSKESNDLVSAKKKTKSELLTFPEWSAKTLANGEKLIPDGHHIFDDAKKMGIPDDYLFLAWTVFKDYYTTDNLKKYKDWRAVFVKSIKGDWLKLWAFNRDGECFLTPKGRMRMNALEADSK